MAKAGSSCPRPEGTAPGTSTSAPVFDADSICTVYHLTAITSGAARPADNHTAIIEFRVEDVDGEYKKLKAVVSDFVQVPTTKPWGNRSLLFRDPDGNLINFFTPASAEAIKKFLNRYALIFRRL